MVVGSVQNSSSNANHTALKFTYKVLRIVRKVITKIQLNGVTVKTNLDMNLEVMVTVHLWCRMVAVFLSLTDEGNDVLYTTVEFTKGNVKACAAKSDL